MKKLLSTLIVSFVFCGAIFAQEVNPMEYESHWADVFYVGDYEDQDGIVAFIQIDGNYITPEDSWQAGATTAAIPTKVPSHTPRSRP